MAVPQHQHFRTRIAACVLAALALPGSARAWGQAVTSAPCVLTQEAAAPAVVVKIPSPAAPKSSPGAIQFYDEPQFTVAGVTDPSQTGGHGSDTVLRTTEALTKETVALNATAASGTAINTSDEASLRAAAVREPGNAAVHHALGNVEEKLGHALAAVREYQRAAELHPSEINLFDWASELLLHRAAEPASEIFTKGHRLFPQSVRMVVGLGVAAYARGSYDLVAQRLCEASELDPRDPNPYLFLGKMQSVDSTQFAGVAERLIERFVRLQPDNAWANYYYALSLWKRREGHRDAGNEDRVKSLLEKAVRLDPHLGMGYLQLGILYADRKDLHRAIGAFQSAINVDSDMEEAHYRLAQAYRMIGEARKSHQELEIYQRVSKTKQAQVGMERQGIQQFVYELRHVPAQPPAPPPQ